MYHKIRENQEKSGRSTTAGSGWRAQIDASQRRWVRSKSTEMESPSGGFTSMVAEPEAKSSAEKSNWRVAPVSSQPPSSEQMRLGWPEEEKGFSFLSSLETFTSKSFQKS